MKEIRLSPSIGTHDLEIKIKQAKEFLEDNKKVQLNMKFSYREMQTSQDIGFKSINYFIEQLKEISNVEFGTKFESSKLIVRLTNLN